MTLLCLESPGKKSGQFFVCLLAMLLHLGPLQVILGYFFFHFRSCSHYPFKNKIPHPKRRRGGLTLLSKSHSYWDKAKRFIS